jgi:hypothetical protein
MTIGMNIGRKFVGDDREWNDHEHHGKDEVLGEWKKLLDFWRGWIGGQEAHIVSQWSEWNGVVK